MSHNIYHMSSRVTIPEYQPLSDTKALARNVLSLPSASGDITRQGFRVTSGLIFWYVTSKPCDICIISYHWSEEENTHSFVIFEWLLFFIWPNFNPLHPRMLCAKFDWNWQFLRKKNLWNFVNIFCYFVVISSLEKGVAFHLNKFESTSPKDALC